MLKKSSILVLVVLVMTTIGYAETFDESDLLGSWYVYEVDVSPLLGAYWLYADLDIAATNDITGNIHLPDGSSMVIESGEADITADGYLSGMFRTDTGLTGSIINGLQDQNHSIFGYVGVDSMQALSFAMGIKGGGDYATADMAGDWRFYAIQIDPNLPGLYWVFGDGTVGADGTVGSGSFRGPDGTEISITGGQFSLSPEGKVSASFEFANGLSSQVSDGMVDQMKTLGLFVDVDNTGRLGYDIALKKGAIYQPGDIEGEWTFYNFTIDPVDQLAFWAYGNGSVDSSGNLTGFFTGPDGSMFTISQGQVFLDSAGEFSGSYSIEGESTATIQSGFMDQNKSIIVFVGSSSDGEMGLGFGFRTSDVPTKWVDISGTVTYEGTPVNAMVLANGQRTFSDPATGAYTLTVPLDANDQITIQAGCWGLAPYLQVVDGTSLQNDIAMQAASPDSAFPTVTTTVSTDGSPEGWARINGTISLADGTPLCAIALANGQYMLTCPPDTTGVYDLLVPLDPSGNITLMVFCAGMQFYSETLTP